MAMSAKEQEEAIAEFWQKKKIYEKVKKQNKGKKKFYFLDGPPYATGKIHVGTALNKVLKDCHIRYFRMAGFDTWDQPGYDTHGVPIENKVEVKLGFKSKGDIEKFGVGKFIQECKSFATEFIDVMGNQFKDLGVWMDWTRPYLTLHNSYIEGAWFTFKKAFEKGLLYKGDYSVHVCPHCETAVAYNEIEYKKVTDNSIFVKFKIKDRTDEYLVVWTTTPWTLPSNTGVMANPEAEYVRVKVGEEIYVLAKKLLEGIMTKIRAADYKVLDTCKGKELEGVKYVNPLEELFPFRKDLKGASRVVLSEQFVSLDEGTGLVHSAPGHGQEDYKVGIENGLPVVNPLRMNGTFNEESGEYSGVYAKKADPMIIEELRARNALLAQESITHDYPMCWRCDTALLMMAVPQWFFRVTAIRDDLIKENGKINWIPDWASARFKNWLESLGDWPISRQRYWGIPLPIWVCEKCGEIRVIGSRQELPKVPKDFHKPEIDEIFLKCKCGGRMKRVPDVMDVWFDSGVAPWASLGYPGDKKLFEKMWPADFILEGPDQIRGWWNSLLITSMMTFDRRPFDNVLFHGFALDAHGIKMSKSKGNIVSTEEVINKYGRDVLRLYYSLSPPWDDFYFKWPDIDDVSKSFVVIRNTFNFVKTYVNKKGSSKGLQKEDKWLLSKLNSLVERCTENFNCFNAFKAAQEIKDFILNDFSRWYIKAVRDRTWADYKGKDKNSAFYTLLTATDVLTRLLAPFCPFTAEQVYQEVLKPFGGKESVHMLEWPKADKRLIDKRAEELMEIAKKITESSYAARQVANIKLRWPVKEVVVVTKEKKVGQAVKEFQGILLKMCNAKKVRVIGKGLPGDFVEAKFDFGSVLIDKKMDKVLMDEALLREIIREVQSLRKKNGFKVQDRIALTLGSDEKTDKFLRKKVKELKSEVGASEVDVGRLEGKHKGSLIFEDKKIEIAFDKLNK